MTNLNVKHVKKIREEALLYKIERKILFIEIKRMYYIVLLLIMHVSIKDTLVIVFTLRMFRMSLDNDGSTRTIMTTIITDTTQQCSFHCTQLT